MKDSLIGINEGIEELTLTLFTFMHLSDAFIQSDLHCTQVTVFTFFFFFFFLVSSCFPWESNP